MAPGREVVVFPGSPGTPAYPAYVPRLGLAPRHCKVITYRCPVLPNPYRDQELLRVNFEERQLADVFASYWKACRRRRTGLSVARKREEERPRPATCSGRLSRTSQDVKATSADTKRAASKPKPNTPRLCPRKASKPKPSERRRASSPAVLQAELPEEPEPAPEVPEVPVKTLWMFGDEVPLSSQARRRSGLAASQDAAVIWCAAPPLPVAASRLAAASVPSLSAVMALGGADASGVSLDAVQLIEKSSFSWRALPPLPTARQALAAASLGGKVCALGGRSAHGSASATVAAEVFDFGQGRWVEMPTLSVARAYHGAAAIDGRIYVLGGQDAQGRRLATVDWLDPREGAQGRLERVDLRPMAEWP